MLRVLMVEDEELTREGLVVLLWTFSLKSDTISLDGALYVPIEGIYKRNEEKQWNPEEQNRVKSEIFVLLRI